MITSKILSPTIYLVSLVLRLCEFVLQVITSSPLSLPLLFFLFLFLLLFLPLSLSLSPPPSPSPRLKLVLIQCSVEGVVIDRVECTQLGHMADYFQPHAPGIYISSRSSVYFTVLNCI